jgi:predicted DNA-binding protein (MmcQ/YjbR family)
MARNMWVQEQQLGETLERSEIEALVKTSYELVVAKLPKSKRPGYPAARTARRVPKKRATKRRASR